MSEPVEGDVVLNGPLIEDDVNRDVPEGCAV